ncbi:hypothetical protein SynPROSU1_00670 [Synechococcus sp. PROS-U-1]|nr:hypothetical protein SynPROSU1_00670 [Synechococcus sp. PROS-U-1]
MFGICRCTALVARDGSFDRSQLPATPILHLLDQVATWRSVQTSSGNLACWAIYSPTISPVF